MLPQHPHNPDEGDWNIDPVEEFYECMFSILNPYESSEQNLQEAMDTIEQFVDRGDPDAIEFVRTLARSNPDVRELDEASWLSFVRGAKSEVYEFMTLLIAKLLKEFSQP